MWLMVIASLMCLGVAVILFTPRFRKISFYRPLSICFLAQSISYLIRFMCDIIWVHNDFSVYIEYVITIVFVGCLLLKLYKTK